MTDCHFPVVPKKVVCISGGEESVEGEGEREKYEPFGRRMLNLYFLGLKHQAFGNMLLSDRFRKFFVI